MASVSDLWFYFILCFIWFVSTLFLRTLAAKLRNSKLGIRLPPSPPALPIIGHLHLLRSNLNRSLQALSSRFGPIMLIRVGASEMVVVSGAGVAREVFKTHDVSFADRAGFGDPGSIKQKGRSFFAAEYGAYWRFLKKMCMMELLSPTQLARFVDIRRQERLNMLGSLAGKAARGEVCDLGVYVTRMTNNTICRVAMSTRCSGSDEESSKVRKMSKEIVYLGGKLSVGDIMGGFMRKLDPFGYGKKLRQVHASLDALLEGMMVQHERAGEGERKDMMDILLGIHKDEAAEVRLSRSDIKSFLLDIFLGGTDTTSYGIQWTLAELINHPEAYDRLREEINEVVGPSRLVQESDVPNLPYLQAVIKESLRLHPPVPLVLRKGREDCKIDGYDIPSNTRVFVNVFAIMRDPELWNDPAEFIPERFVVNSGPSESQQDQVETRGHSFDFLPFGGGRRGCPGSGLATTMMQVTVAVLVQCFDWKIKGGEKIRMEEGTGFSQGLAHPILVYPIMRVNPTEVANAEPVY